MKKRKSYIFTNKKHSNRAVMATILGIISLSSLGVMVFLSYRSGGQVGGGFGVGALLAAIYSTVGLVLGLLTVQERENYRLFPVLAIVLNLAALAGLCLIVYMGGSLN